jgi:hypothetical protein
MCHSCRSATQAKKTCPRRCKKKLEYLNTLLSRYKKVESILLRLPARAQTQLVARPRDARTTNPWRCR